MTSLDSLRAAKPGIDPREFRDNMGKFASGVTIITGHDDNEPIGFTCQSFYSVSLEPALVSFSVMKTSSSYPRIQAGRRFAVNILQRDQQQLSNQFAQKKTDKWAGVEWKVSGNGNPILSESLLWVDCEISAEYDAGDHLIIVGAVTEIGSHAQQSELEPLIFYRGSYRKLTAADAR